LVPEELEQHRIAFALEQAASAARIGLFATLVIALTAWPGTGFAPAAAWAALLAGLLLVRNRLLRRASQWLATPRGSGPAFKMLSGSSVVIALALGLLPAAAFPGMAVELRLLLTLFLCCWCAAGMSSLGVTPGLYSAYLAIVLGGVAVGWLRSATPDAVFTAIALALYGLVLRAFAANFARRIADGIAIRAENAELVRQLSLANEAKTRFIMAASHDLRQPLHAISYLGGVLARARNPEDIRHATDALGTAVEGLNKLFSAILDLSRIESGAVRTNLVPFKIDALVGQLDSEYRGLCVSGGRRWECLVETATVHSDPALLERILRNLLDNAMKHGGTGTVRLEVWMRDEVRITVSDTGPGIPPHERQRVFEEFYRVKDGGGQPGLGLGLSIVRRLVDRLGCRIDIGYTDPELQLGTAITLHVPRGTGLAEDESAAHAAPDDAEEHDVSGLAVLVVDDDAAVLGATRALLGQWGCSVALCTGPADMDRALEGLGTPDVALMDYQLGAELHGLELAARLRARFPAMGVVMVTGESDEKVLAQLAESGLPVLEKPVSPHELRLTLSLFKAAGE
jgi:signal transduction histidine kinase